MKIINALLLSLMLFTTAAQADTTLFGMALGKSTIQDIKEKFILPLKGTPTPNTPIGWVHYTISGEQFQNPQPIHVRAFFDNRQVLGRLTFTWPKSEELFDALESSLSHSYNKLQKPLHQPNSLRTSFFQNDQTKVELQHSTIGGTHLSFINLKYLSASKKFNKANKDATQ